MGHLLDHGGVGGVRGLPATGGTQPMDGEIVTVDLETARGGLGIDPLRDVAARQLGHGPARAAHQVMVMPGDTAQAIHDGAAGGREGIEGTGVGEQRHGALEGALTEPRQAPPGAGEHDAGRQCRTGVGEHLDDRLTLRCTPQPVGPQPAPEILQPLHLWR